MFFVPVLVGDETLHFGTRSVDASRRALVEFATLRMSAFRMANTAPDYPVLAESGQSTIFLLIVAE